MLSLALESIPTSGIEEQKRSGEGPAGRPASAEDEKVGPHSFMPIMMLGKGSFGEVYLVRKKGSRSNRLYAMKVLLKSKIMGQNLIKYARTERNVLAFTQHPFIVGLNYAFQCL